MGKTKRKFIEGHSYIEMYKLTRNFSFGELENSYKAVEDYMKDDHDMRIPVCVRLKVGDLRVKKYDEQIGLDPTNYYSNAYDLAFIVENTYKSRKAVKERFLSGETPMYDRLNVATANAIELLNIKMFLEDLRGQWIYLDKEVDENGKYYIMEVVSPEVIRTIYKHDLTSRKARNEFLSMYVNTEDTNELDIRAIVNLLNHFRPVENVYKEVLEAIENL